MSTTKILIDCDPGHDDALAILYAAKHLDLIGLTTVHGNNSLENTTRNALAVLELGGIDVPVARGCDVPLAQPRAASADVHGATGLDGANLPEPANKPIATHAIDFLIEIASRHREELVVAVLGPQTNIAVALRREPRLKQWLRELTIMGGSTTRGNVTPAAEFNIHCDPEAAWAVFNSGIPSRMVGLNVTRENGIQEADIDRLRGSGRRVAGVVADLMGFYFDRQREKRPTDMAPIHDVCAIVPLVNESLIRYADGQVDIELTGTHTRGMTVCDLSSSPSTEVGGPTTKIAVDAERRPLVDHVIETILTYP